MHFLLALQQSWPKLLFQLLLSQDQLCALARVVDLALGDINLAPELELDVVISLEGLRVARVRDGSWLDIELEVLLLDVRHDNAEVDEVLCGIGLVGSLGPKDYLIHLVS